MKAIVLEFLANFWVLLNSIAFFILIGVVIAAIFKLLLPDAFIKKHLGEEHFMANIKAAILGIPLPLCSCSVIPFISALKKSGASRSAIQTFLIATPITGADSIIATYAVFGWLFTLYRVLSAIIISLLAGLLSLLFVKEQSFALSTKEKFKAASFKKGPAIIGKPLTIKVVKAEEQHNIVQKVISYAFDDIYKDIARSLLIGLLLGALIVTFMPDNLVDFISASPLLNYALVLAVSIPLYVCATASIPLGLALLSAGFSPGAAFIFLTAGPATNTMTMAVVLKTLGKSSLIIYLSSVILGSLFFGFLFDVFFPDSLSNMFVIDEYEEQAGFISQISSVILLYLSIMYTFNNKAKVVKSGGCSGGGCSSGGSKT